MPSNVTLFESLNTHHTSVDVELFDPPMCCSTGLCGPAVDQTLLDVNEMALKLKSAGVKFERYQMSSSPNVFMSNLYGNSKVS